MFGLMHLVRRTDGLYTGLRMSADELLRIVDEGNNYELIDGVIMMTPSPAPEHQHISFDIANQLYNFLKDKPIGSVLMETDVHFGVGRRGDDFVYRPEVIFYRAERMQQVKKKLKGVPDLVVEVVSAGSRRFDSQTKKADHERFGVREYWLIDPENESFIAFQLKDGRYVENEVTGDTYETEVIPGSVLDVTRVRALFEP